ncbi:MAG: hypothetical protein MUO72_04210 [Bacteroidales bacterium]|nr:hypothetical protein [Bacteroidales bacterium]
MKFDFYFDNDKIITARFLNDKNDSAYNTLSFDKFSRVINQLNSSSNPIKEIRYSYNEKALKSTEFQFPKNQPIFKKTEIYYNKQYQPIKKLVFAGDTSLIAYWLYKYNDNGDLIEERFVNKFQSIITIPKSDLSIGFEEFTLRTDYLTTYSIFYDNLKRPLTKMEYYNSKKKSRTEYFYSSDSSTIKTTTYFNFKYNLYPRRINITTAHDSIKIVKDLNLNIPDSTIIDSELKFLYVNNEVRENFQRGPHYNFKYSIRTETHYDSHDNWIKKISYSNQRINGILERIITY